MQYAQPDPENLVYFDQYLQGDKNAFKNRPDFEKIQGNTTNGFQSIMISVQEKLLKKQ